MFRTILFAAAMAVAATSVPAQTLERIKETKSLKLGFRTDAPPLSYLATDGGPAGYSVALCGALGQAIANVLEMEELNAEFVPVTAQDRFEKVASGEIDLLCGAATITMTRRELVDFSIPTFVDGAAVMLPKGAAANLTALSGKKVGVRKGTTTLEALTNTLAGAKVDTEVVEFDNHVEGMNAMMAGDLAAYFADQSILLFLKYSTEGAESVNVMDRLLTVEKHGLAMARGDTEFRFLVDGALSGMYANGTIPGLYAEALGVAHPGIATQALFLIAPTLP
jgi:polar amino acid transport system substrate-binding protein/glutamate/aspartate transport system substrate-binding protein